MNLRKKLIVATSTCMSLGMFAAAPVFAADATGTTPVQYDSRNIIEGVENEWGVIIPTAITFTEEGQKKDAKVTLVDLSTAEGDFRLFNPDFKVEVDVKSANEFLLKSDEASISAKGTYKLDETGFEVSVTAKTHEGKAELLSAPSVEGVYKDTLTYTMTGVGNTFK